MVNAEYEPRKREMNRPGDDIKKKGHTSVSLRSSDEGRMRKKMKERA